jgi:hypothetical protein
MWPDSPKNVRDAYYKAVAELGVHRDLLQVHIGSYLQAVKELRERVANSCPTRVERFRKAEELTTKGLVDDVSGNKSLRSAPSAGPPCT